MKIGTSKPRSTRRIVVAIVVGLLTSIGVSPSVVAAQPTYVHCEGLNLNGYYCYYNDYYWDGYAWDAFYCYSNTWKAYPSWIRDEVGSWTHKQIGGAWVTNWNWRSSVGQYAYRFTMGPDYDNDNYVAYKGEDRAADTLNQNDCT